ncbi:MAG: NAD(P)-dependent alcohol dehydrogenase [Bacteroidetes bacterium]|nr:NAD(P)-dependent alcohol dehydrogenase [Bacteroidota bacterium]MBI3481701.1 NAD(P)-dependent alcohol dehydrogenase [Bacteroidota bacterium]
MKAAVRSKYGIPGDLTVKELDTPTPKDDEVLIRVYAATVNRTDCHVLSGKPFPMRFFTGLFKPRKSIIGTDFAGQIEAVGSSVQSFKEGEKVMGFGGVFGCGSLAQYFTMSEAKANKTMVSIPDNLTNEQAAAFPEGSFYAASIIIQLKPRAGQKALVYGATGAIGSAYVQYLKYFDVYVTAVCKGENADLVKSLGASKVIDFEKEDFTKDNEQYDFVFDAVGKSSFIKCRRLLKPNGIYTSSGGAENLLWVLITPLLGGKKVPFLPPKDIKGSLNFIKDLFANGNFRPVIDRKYPMEKIAEAFTYVASGQKIGNVIVTMD